MKSLIKDAIAGSSSDFVEIRLEDTSRLELAYSGKELKKAQMTRDYGGYVRALKNGSWGYRSFTQPALLKEHVKAADERAEAAGAGNIKLAAIPVSKDTISLKLNDDDDPRAVPFEQKVDLFGRLAQTIMSQSEKIISGGVNYREEERHIIFANSEGTMIDFTGFWGAGGISAIGRDGNIVQSVYSGFGTRDSWREIIAVEEEVDSVVKGVLNLLRAEPVNGGRYTIILDPRLAGVFIHEAFGHLSEADGVSDNPGLLKQMTLGTRFGQDFLNVVDAGVLDNERGSYKYDDEGTPSTKTYLIKNGLLSGRLHSRETAESMGEPLTGNARTINFRFAPICRMSNTYIDKGPHNFEQMLEGVDAGLYVSGGGSGNTSKGLFTFSAEKAQVIEKGKLGGWIRDLTLTGNVFETLRNIDMVGSDLARSRAGGCGKSVGARMQYPLFVSMGSPHIRIQNVLIGGR